MLSSHFIVSRFHPLLSSLVTIPMVPSHVILTCNLSHDVHIHPLFWYYQTMLSSPLSTHINIPCYHPLLSFDVIAHCYHLLIISPFTVSTMLLPSCYRQCDPNTYKKSKDKTPIYKALKTKRRQDKTSTTFFLFYVLTFDVLSFDVLSFEVLYVYRSLVIISFYNLILSSRW
jgi:hypothetical protein